MEDDYYDPGNYQAKPPQNSISLPDGYEAELAKGGWTPEEIQAFINSGGATVPTHAHPGYHQVDSWTNPWGQVTTGGTFYQLDAPTDPVSDPSIRQLTDGTGGQTSGQGLFDPSLYAPFRGQAPSYNQPNLPNAPNFDNYYNQSAYPTPVYRAPTMRQAPAFEPGKFTAPTIEEAQNQPGYQFGVQQGEKALQQSRASQGLLRTGGTLKDILDYGRNAATQNYGNVFNQNLAGFRENEGGRVNAYNANYGTQYRDPNNYDLTNAQTAFQGQLQGNRQALDVAQARFAPQLLQYQTDAANAQRQAELGYNADWQKYLDSENVFYNNQSGPFSKYLSLAQLGAANA